MSEQRWNNENLFMGLLEDSFEDLENTTFTENGAMAYKTTKSAVLDFFSQGGAMRSRTEQEIIDIFWKAFQENPVLSIKCLFYLRDVRGGQGERRLFRVIMRYLANNRPQITERLYKYIPEFGRYDDMLSLFGTPLEYRVATALKEQLFRDLEQSLYSDNISLLAKWLPSEHSKNQQTKELARMLSRYFEMSPRKYRKTMALLRKKINIVESKMSAKKWDEINYEHVPSVAGLKYRKAFKRNDEERYLQFLDDVTSGKKKINTQAIYPYQLVQAVLSANSRFRFYMSSNFGSVEDLHSVNVMWDNLPDYIGDKYEEALVVADVSGSMLGMNNDCIPLANSIALAIYYAERNKGAFKNKFITFSSRPSLQEVKGSTLEEKVKHLENADWEMNTNIHAVFRLILDTAIRNNVKNEDMIKKLYIVSDMEFDVATRGNNDEKLFAQIEREFANHGYTLPKLVFWNVDARNNQFPVTSDSKYTQLVSGFSPVIFEKLIGNDDLSPYAFMLEVLNDERYGFVDKELRFAGM